jgi:hypothetical protein
VNLSDPGGNMVVVTDQDGNDLFSLDDGLDDITRMTSSEAYDKKIQWFEESADNYMELISIAPGFADHAGVKHFSWDDIARFSDKDRYWFSFYAGMSGDWKASSNGADGYRLVSVDGQPYWADAIGQIPFAVDTYRSYRMQGLSHNDAAEQTLLKALQFHDGSIGGSVARVSGLSSLPTDTSQYDNLMVSRTVEWAQHRWSYSFELHWLGSSVLETNNGYGYNKLAYR